MTDEIRRGRQYEGGPIELSSGTQRVKVIVTCAAITNGCAMWLIFDAPQDVRNVDIDHLDPEVPEDAYIIETLTAHGWHESYGRWVCPAHPGSDAGTERAAYLDGLRGAGQHPLDHLVHDRRGEGGHVAQPDVPQIG